MESATFKLWEGRWQRQDAEWSHAATVGDWRLRPIGENELSSMVDRGGDLLDKLTSMAQRATGMIYVMVVKVREGLTARVPLIPVDPERFLTLAHYTGKPGSDHVVDVRKEDFEKFAGDLVRLYEPLASAPSWAVCQGCAVCKEPYVTGDPILRYRPPKSNKLLSVHYLCGIVKAADVFRYVIGANVYVSAADRLTMTKEDEAAAAVIAACERGNRLVEAKTDGPIPDAEFEWFRREMSAHLNAIDSRTPYRNGITAKDLHETIADMEQMVVAGLRSAAARALKSRPGRNDPCSCGSGVKFKRCCGSSTP